MYSALYLHVHTIPGSFSKSYCRSRWSLLSCISVIQYIFKNWMNSHSQPHQYIFIIKMSDLEIDNIIKKYDRSVSKPRFDLMYTQRKKESRDPHLITFMDNSYTASKQKTEHKTPNDSGRAQELLRQLDEAENKYAISQRNYADICRKYDKLKQAYEMVSGELEKERKIRLQELIDTQNKLALLQTDNGKNLTKLESKEHTIAILKQKLSQKEEEIQIFQVELENISKKLCETLELKDRGVINSQLDMTNEQAQKTLEGFRVKYEKIISSLNSEITNFNKDLLQKEKEKKKLLAEMDELSKKHLKEIKELKEVLAKNEEQYKNWLDESKQQKLGIIQKYEHQIREARKSQFMEKLSKSDNLIDETSRSKSLLKEMEMKIIELQNQVKKLNIEIQKQNSSQKQSQIKNENLQEELKHLKSEYLHQLNENKKFLAKAKEDEEKFEKLRMKFNKNEIQLASVKMKNEEAESQIKLLKNQVQNLKSDMGKELKSLIGMKKELNEATNNELNMNSMLTQASTKLQLKIKTLESQLESVTTELYAQRLQKAKLADELEETKIELKREYDLSLENTRRQLQQQIKWNTHEKTEAEMDKQKLYLNMFKLERQYQLLKSQVVTTEEMLRMGTKMSKYYQKRVK